MEERVPARRDELAQDVYALEGDIAERKRAEEAHALLAAIVESSSDPIISKSLQGMVISWNQAAEDMFGYSAAEMIGQSILRIIPPNRAAEEETILARLKAGERIAHYDTVRVTKDGRHLDVSLTISPIRDGSGTIIGASKIIHDISERKRAEAALERQTRELTRSNAELEQFASLISHDLRAPLVSLSSSAGLLLEQYNDQLDDDAKELIGFIVSAVKRMDGLIRSLRNYSRLDSTGLERTPCDCNGILDGVLETLQGTLATRHAEVTHDPLPVVAADEKQLAQLFQNLIENGIKYNRQPVPRVHFSVQGQQENWTFAVKDNGIGISPEQFEPIFQIFHRLHPDDSAYSGIGVGLAFCKKIVERHGGRIWVESNPGEGSTFYFTLPRQKG